MLANCFIVEYVGQAPPGTLYRKDKALFRIVSINPTYVAPAYEHFKVGDTVISYTGNARKCKLKRFKNERHCSKLYLHGSNMEKADEYRPSCSR